jgi:F-type H+-transporting ATPase subunit a
MATSPLHQFEIHELIPFKLAGHNLAFTNSSLFMLLTVIAATTLMILPMRRAALIPGRWQTLPEVFYEFIQSLVRDVIGPGGMKFLPFVFTLFMMVFMGNMLGMIPYSFTFTSHIIVTAVLGVLVFLVVTIMGFVNHGWHFLSLFAPSGLPKFIYIILVPIEIISFLSRPVTLAVRLCANMMAGHTVLKVFAGFSVAMIAASGALQFASILPLILNALIVALELLVAVLQAYIFTILTCVYLKDAVELHH